MFLRVVRLTFVHLLVGLAAFSSNLNNFDCEFVYDDPGAILGNEDVLTPLNWERLGRHDFWGRDLIEPVSHRSFRPITVVSFRLNYLMTGEFERCILNIFRLSP